MPVSRSSTTTSPELDRLRPYTFHGIDLTPKGSHAVGDCPFCGRDGKFAVEIATGLWRCFVCGSGTAAGGGNALVFVRALYERSYANVGDSGGIPAAFLAAVAADRGVSPASVAAWGVAQGPDGTWLVPGYSPDERLDQVYRRTKVRDKDEWVWRLLPTPGLWPEGKVHSLHLPLQDFNPTRAAVVVCEGPWDGMSLWENGRKVWGDANIVAVPGCNVWRDDWTELCRGKQVTLLFDSDHPRTHAGRTSRAGFDGMQRVAKKLSGIAASVQWIRWGKDGYDPTRPSGWDVRDHLTETADKTTALAELLGKLEPVPADWFLAGVATNGAMKQGKSIEARECSSWAECEAAWQKAMRWRPEMSDAMAVLLAVCASTNQPGNQLFLDLIGAPGSAKTTLCKGLLVSSNCVHVENISKIISGFKKADDPDKDCSFLARSNGKTWVTCEFDTLGSSPQYHELMGKIRRIFDGETSAIYGNLDEDRIYTALRTPWIRAGTPAMMDHDQSQLGDRFIRFILSDPDNREKREIARRAILSERAAMLETVNCTAGSIVDSDTRLAHALTGGYVDWLRANIEDRLTTIEVPLSAEDQCIDLAELAADMRARPKRSRRRGEDAQEVYDCKEMPTRLARQNIRLASCLAVVLGRPQVDRDVMRVVRKVALDTAHGVSLNIVQWLCSPNPRNVGHTYQETGGLMEGMLSTWTGMMSERLTHYLTFLRKIGVLELKRGPHGGDSWLLTDRVLELYLRVMNG